MARYLVAVLLAGFLLCLGVLPAAAQDDDLESRLAALEERITALEAVIAELTATPGPIPQTRTGSPVTLVGDGSGVPDELLPLRQGTHRITFSCDATTGFADITGVGTTTGEQLLITPLLMQEVPITEYEQLVTIFADDAFVFDVLCDGAWELTFTQVSP